MADGRRGWLAAFARQPLVHFLLIGAALFAAYRVRNPGDDAASSTIAIDRGRVQWLADTFATQVGHRPSRAELDNMVRAFATEEMSYREALALGLDADDSIVRRRLIQKYEFMALDEPPAEPDEATLRAYFAKNTGRYQSAPVADFCHVYVAATPDRAAAIARVRGLAGQLTAGQVDPDNAGDPIELPACMTAADPLAIRRDFGVAFAQFVGKLPVGGWVAPVESGLGFHAVRVTARRPGPPTSFESRRQLVREDWLEAEKARLQRERMAELRARYRVDVDQAAVARAAAP